MGNPISLFLSNVHQTIQGGISYCSKATKIFPSPFYLTTVLTIVPVLKGRIEWVVSFLALYCLSAGWLCWWIATQKKPQKKMENEEPKAMGAKIFFSNIKISEN